VGICCSVASWRTDLTASSGVGVAVPDICRLFSWLAMWLNDIFYSTTLSLSLVYTASKPIYYCLLISPVTAAASVLDRYSVNSARRFVSHAARILGRQRRPRANDSNPAVDSTNWLNWETSHSARTGYKMVLVTHVIAPAGGRAVRAYTKTDVYTFSQQHNQQIKSIKTIWL